MVLHDLRRRIITLIRYAKNFGLLSALRLTLNYFKSNSINTIFQKKDVLSFYAFVRLPAAKTNFDDSALSSTTINWVIPPYREGSGGHINIFRFVSNLEKIGFDCRIVIVCEPQPETVEQAKKEIDNWFFPLAANVYLGMENAPPAMFTIATEWRTAYWVRNFETTKHRCYFVQDFEPWFFPMGAEYIFAEETYRFGFVGITAGDWLKVKLSTEYGMTAHSVGFSFDKELYRPLPKHDQIKRIFFYSRPPTPRRAFELGLLVLDEVTKRMPEVEVVLAGWDISNYAINFKHTSAGLLTVDALPDLYCQCNVALVLSLSNLSLLPLELMACGIPVVSNRAPWTEWLLNNQNSRLAATTVVDLADALCAVLANEKEAMRIRHGGFDTVAVTDWYTEASKMALILDELESATDEESKSESFKVVH
ncbi:MAG: glycosyl transferase group 1 [Solimicrobium sp.]|jgi:glycosyltransferase involved in cell wall biosynthesis|nr:glycosyl transferase group 1 [Solimicrobium sp.]